MFSRRVWTRDSMAVFLTAKAAKGLSPRTIETYSYRLGIFARRFPKLPVCPEPIEGFLANVGPTQETRETYYRLLRNFYRFLRRRRLIHSNPLDQIEPPILQPKVARSLKPEQLRLLLTNPDHPAQVRAFLYLLADTGLRLSEALAIDRVEKLGLDTVVTTGKTGEREVPVSPSVAGMVADALPWPWSSRDAAGLAVRKAFRRAGIVGKRASAHTLRHTFVRLWEGDESLLVGILGWTTPRMLKVYRPYDLARAIRQHLLHSPIRGLDTKARQLSLL
ncbi:hypothetical protein LCGC14_0987330 [marine sediment metagenome]|uniref:Tyr recombinase domain-containing protein n=1 Tax=marine sediment metagenome TaxID=412755 RepID=A0A0F9QQA5_9ZZZZ